MAHGILANCDGCTACLRQCPTAAIRGERGVLHVIDEVFCIDCGVCGWICPIEAVVDAHGVLVPRLPRQERPHPRIDTTLCNGCGLCTEICPFDCLRVVGPAYQGLVMLHGPERCVSCGECETICIKGAVRMKPVELRGYDVDRRREELERVLDEAQEPVLSGRASGRT